MRWRQKNYIYAAGNLIGDDQLFHSTQQEIRRASLDFCRICPNTLLHLREEIPGLGEVVAFDVTHIYAFVKENNPRVYVKERFKKEQQPRGDRDCKLGVKKSTNREMFSSRKLLYLKNPSIPKLISRLTRSSRLRRIGFSV